MCNCSSCGAQYDERTHWSQCPHATRPAPYVSEDFKQGVAAAGDEWRGRMKIALIALSDIAALAAFRATSVQRQIHAKAMDGLSAICERQVAGNDDDTRDAARWRVARGFLSCDIVSDWRRGNDSPDNDTEDWRQQVDSEMDQLIHERPDLVEAAGALEFVAGNEARCPKCGARVESIGNPCPAHCGHAI